MFLENIAMIMMLINMLYPLRKGKNHCETTQKSSATPDTVPRAKLIPPGFRRTRHRHIGEALPECRGGGTLWRWRDRATPQSHEGDITTSVVLKDRSSDQRGLSLSLKDLMEFALLSFVLAQDPSSISSFWIFPFGMRMFILCLSHHCILKAHNMPAFTGS